MKFALLWTDSCLLVVVALGVIFVGMGLRKSPMRRAFKRIISKPIAASSGIVLLFFLLIGVLDSIHTEEANKSSSVLDRIMAPVGDQYEKTYSAPIALDLFTTETMSKNGQVQQMHPRLKYPPPKMNSEALKWQFIEKALYQSLLLDGTVLLVLLLLFALYQKGVKKGARIRFSAAQISALGTLFLCLFFIFSSFAISRELHVLGTGKIGQDIFYYAVKSIRTGLIIGILTTLFMMPLALALGIAAGFFGGWVDDVIQYIYTTLSSIPGVLLITASVLSMQTYIANHPEQFTSLAQNADARLLALCLILGVTSWTSLCRLLRAESLKLREIDFVIAAKAMGTSNIKILYKHLLPNLMHIVVITLVLDFSFLVLAEAVLAYVGVGVSPMTISWGNMINAARLELAREPVVWWPMLAAFVFMFTLVLASNLFADVVRDAFDPRRAD